MPNNPLPLISCVMPTANRPQFVPNAIRYFLRQDYENKELLIVDDGSESIENLIPDHPQIRYIRTKKQWTLGEKRNFCVQKSRGDLIMHWDDDDWMADYRISYQVRELLKHKAEVCGLQNMYFCQLATRKCWLYKYPPKARSWLAGGSLLYTREFWKKMPFPSIQVASDTPFILSRELKNFVALSDHNFYVAAIHGKNTSPKRTTSKIWKPVATEVVKRIIGTDWVAYTLPGSAQTGIVPAVSSKKANQPQKVVSPQNPIYLKTQEFGKPSQKAKGTKKIRVALMITTYKRPQLLKQTLQAIKKEARSFVLTCFVIDDAILGNGKKGYWKTVNALWNQVRQGDFDYYIQLPDDMLLEKRFIKRAIESWNNIIDPKKICLNLLLDNHRLGKTNWTNYWPQISTFNGTRYLKAQWVDMFYICEKAFFERMGWAIHPISLRRWQIQPTLSSGVGQQISTRLHKSGWHLYQTTQKLVEHLGDDSKMNPATRQKEPLNAIGLSPIYAGMASIPSREKLLKNTIDSIHPYIDHLFLFLNEYPHIPSWLSHYPKVSPFLSKKEKTNMGDAGKFYGLNKIQETDFYYFPLDDDLIYPPDYVWKMIQKIEKYERKSIISCGGYNMKSIVNHFYADRSQNWHISTKNNKDRPAQILHSALAAWHSSTLSFRYEHCQKANMGDLWLAIAAQKQQVPMVLIERPAKWVAVQKIPIAKTIYGKHYHNCQDQTAVFNSLEKWEILPIR